jgi:hypothetical protein
MSNTASTACTMDTDQPSDAEFYDRDMSESPAPSQEPPPSTNPMSPTDQTQADNGQEQDNTLNPIHEDSASGNVIERPPESSQSSISSSGGLSGRSSPSQAPAREPGAWTHTQIQIHDSVTDAARFPLCMERFYHPNGLMQPRDQDLSSLDANGKAWVMERPPLSLPIDGNSWSFVDECHAGITNELLKVLYFFDLMNGMSNHFLWNGFVVGTSDISGSDQCTGTFGTSLKPSYAPNNKDINGVMLSEFKDQDRPISFRGSHRGVDTDKLLSSSELSSTGTVYTPLPLFRISISFTAGMFESSRVQHAGRRRARQQDDSDDEDEQRQAIFGVATVTALRNMDTLGLIMV